MGAGCHSLWTRPGHSHRGRHAFLPLGILGLLAGSGILLRQQWGRILTLILAVLAILLGLVWVAGGTRMLPILPLEQPRSCMALWPLSF